MSNEERKKSVSIEITTGDIREHWNNTANYQYDLGVGRVTAGS